MAFRDSSLGRIFSYGTSKTEAQGLNGSNNQRAVPTRERLHDANQFLVKREKGRQREVSQRRRPLGWCVGLAEE
jgi:hypothetical protein